MIKSVSKELFQLEIPTYSGEVKMRPFYLGSLIGVPEQFKHTVKTMISALPSLFGTAYLTVDGRVIEKGQSHRRGGPHIDGNYIPDICGWGSGGGNGWKVGEGGRILSSEHHKLSYQSSTGGMLIASTHPACKGWNGVFNGEAYVGGDCSRIELNEGFILKAKTLYYGNSQFIHESLPVDKTVERTLIRITLPINYPVITFNS